MSGTVEIRSGGKRYRGWTSVAVRSSLEESAGQFTVSLTLFDPDSASPIDIGCQSACEVWLDDERIITGIVDAIDVTEAPDGVAVTVEGRSKTAQLECSVATAARSHKRQTQLAIAQALASPFGVSVVLGDGVVLDRRLGVWRSKAKESAFEAVERLLRRDNVLVTDDAEGRLVLDRVPQTAQATETIEIGSAPVLRLSHRVDVSEVFSTYYCRGQSYGTDNDNGEAVSQPSAFASDPDVTLHRPFVLEANGATNRDSAQARARTEAAVRAGRSVPVSLTLAGWRWPSGRIVRKRDFVHVRSERARLDGVFVVVDVDYRKAHDEGEVAELVLMPPGAFAVEEIVAKPSRTTGTNTSAAARARVSKTLRAAVGMWK